MKYFYISVTFIFFSIECFANSFFDRLDFEGEISLSGRYFPSSPEYDGQEHNNYSVSFESELFYEFEEKDSLVVSPFARIDSVDSNRSKFDFREFLYTDYGDDWEASLGVGQVFWGVTESRNIVDMINQVDEVEDPFAQTKLGQPMANYTLIKDEGYFEFYLLPYFRTRTFPGKQGRLRTDPYFLKDNPKFEGGSRWTPELAFRWLNTFNDIDLSSHIFLGYAKNPSIDSRVIDGKINYGTAYQRIRQIGGTFQKTADSTLYKIELISRKGQRNSKLNRKDFIASVVGLEHSFYRVVGDNGDIALILEYNYDSRKNQSSELLQDDLFIASRFTLNDNLNTEFFLSSIFDLNGDGQTYQLEFARRVTDSIKGNIKGSIYQNGKPTSTLYILRQDSWIELELKYFF